MILTILNIIGSLVIIYLGALAVCAVAGFFYGIYISLRSK